jgi:thioredoxin 1
MNKPGKIAIVALLLIAVGTVIAMKKNTTPQQTTPAVTATSETVPALDTKQALPHLLDLGAGKCIPCKMMKPILEQLHQEYAEQLEVTFIDVWENQEAGAQYGIRMIPTQIFFDAQGKEQFRHEGFMSKEEILSKWKELGIVFDAPKSDTPSNQSPTR